MKEPELLKSEVDVFIEEKVELLLSHIQKDEKDVIFVNREIIGPDGAVFHHFIHVCPVERLCNTEYWDNSEIFNEKDSNLFLYLKGRLLIQTTTTWEIYEIHNNLFAKEFELTCNYSIKETVV